MSMEKIKIIYSFEDSVVTILLDDGKGNVLDHIMMEELQNTFNSFAENKDIKLIVLEGTGKHLPQPCSGLFTSCFIQFGILLFRFCQKFPGNVSAAVWNWC